MAAATADAPGASEQLVAQPDTSIVFCSRREELKLVLKRTIQTYTKDGEVAETISGKRLKFTDGMLRVPRDPKATVRDEHGNEIPAGEVLKFLEKHHLYGNRMEGFWELEQPAPPVSEQELGNLTDLTIALDVEGLVRLIAEEGDGWARVELLNPAKRALKAARAKLAEQAPPPPPNGDQK